MSNQGYDDGKGFDFDFDKTMAFCSEVLQKVNDGVKVSKWDLNKARIGYEDMIAHLSMEQDEIELKLSELG